MFVPQTKTPIAQEIPAHLHLFAHTYQTTTGSIFVFDNQYFCLGNEQI
jgi:hypothetical protein